MSLRTLVALLALGCIPAAHAATIEARNCASHAELTCVVSVSNLDVAGVSYNVAFVHDSFDNIYTSGTAPAFTDLPSAGALGQALASVFNASALGRIDYGAGGERAFFWVPFTVAGDVGYGRWTYQLGSWGDPYFGAINAATAGFYAVAIAPVPVPAAVWLFVSALMGLVAVRRADRRRGYPGVTRRF